MSQRMRDRNDETLDALTRLVAAGTPVEIRRTPTTFAVCVLSTPPKWYDAGTVQDAICAAAEKVPYPTASSIRAALQQNEEPA